MSNCLFGSVKLTKNADLDKYRYIGYGMGFDSCGEYSWPDKSVGKEVINFGIYMSSSMHIDNKGKYILILGKGQTQGLDGTWFTTEALHPINFTQSRKRFALSPHYKGSNSFLFVYATKIIISKQKNLK